jgi:hypothetical protein
METKKENEGEEEGFGCERKELSGRRGDGAWMEWEGERESGWWGRMLVKKGSGVGPTGRGAGGDDGSDRSGGGGGGWNRDGVSWRKMWSERQLGEY